jgi:hypothetical protein
MRVRYGQNWYTPMEVARKGLILNSRGSKGSTIGTYHYVLGLIRSGQLGAKNYSLGKKRANYQIPESEIARYHETINPVDVSHAAKQTKTSK